MKVVGGTPCPPPLLFSFFCVAPPPNPHVFQLHTRAYTLGITFPISRVDTTRLGIRFIFRASYAPSAI
jgi:hypothetical protein